VHIHVLALFPEMLGGVLAAGIIKRARERGLVDVHLHQLRDYATGAISRSTTLRTAAARGW
jgi:tRNA (guanine37-N1)-methyltransferase